MKKLALGLLLLLTLTLTLAPAALAADIELITDDAYLLTDGEYRELNEKAAEIAEQYRCEVVVITVDDIGGGDAYDAAVSLYDEYHIGYGAEKSGLLLLLSMAERDYALVAYGFGNDAFTDHGKDVLLDRHVLPLLARDEYYNAFSVYLETAAEYLQMARAGTPFDQNTDPNYGKMGAGLKLAITILLPLLIAGIICLIWRGQIKSAVIARTADNYIPADGFALTGREDRFLYRTEVRRRIERSSSGGTTKSSSGHSGRSGKF